MNSKLLEFFTYYLNLPLKDTFFQFLSTTQKQTKKFLVSKNKKMPVLLELKQKILGIMALASLWFFLKFVVVVWYCQKQTYGLAKMPAYWPTIYTAVHLDMT